MSAKTISLEELQQHKTKDSFYILINGKVYDCTKFIDEHPGGDDVILAEAGKDATEAFDDVGHSEEARSLLPGMLIGDFEGGIISNRSATAKDGVSRAVEQGSNLMYVFPLAALGAYFAWRLFGSA